MTQEVLQRLDDEAKRLLDECVSLGSERFFENLSSLQLVAESASLIAQGEDGAKALSPRLQNLVAWAVNFDDARWVEAFMLNVLSGNFCSPWEWFGRKLKDRKN